MRCPRLLSMLCLGLAMTGCNGSSKMSQRLTGEWVGEPETVVERTVRQWPGRAGGKEVSADYPEVAAAIREAPVTDLEASALATRVTMRLDESGEAKLSLAGKQPLTGEWSLTPLEGGRAQLEIEIEKDDEESPVVRRRFELEFLREGEGFTLREQSADRRFGTLLFTRPASAASNQPTRKQEELQDE